ncbi:type II restriction endonuclease [Periweissella beninensis]|uniref:type II restriction endonuclease n=1 Tax=Periweissella beninensis TaxID=504936 RepID=UPI0021A967C4|nr:type II restriction endonuclease [Periweissella beninensis]MCT4395453.1 restriction endonuclease [Periweissella beninensis]
MDKKTLNEYLALDDNKKFDYFFNTRQTLSLPANYWINFENVKKNMEKYGPDVFTLDYLIGKSSSDLDYFFTDRPELLKLVPQLLGIRDNKFEAPVSKKILKVEGVDGEYLLDFKNIDIINIKLYLKFIHDSGLGWLLLKGISKSIKDYSTGIEAGMDSNGRKNRSGQRGELFIEALLEKLAIKYDFEWKGQTNYTYIEQQYNIQLDKNFKNVRFDGSLYDRKNNKLYLFEINNFSSQGSKLKASGGEFSLRQQLFNNSNCQFVYITDGQGWASDSSHLKTILKSIKYVFNFSMIQDGYIDDLIQKISIE